MNNKTRTTTESATKIGEQQTGSYYLQLSFSRTPKKNHDALESGIPYAFLRPGVTAYVLNQFIVPVSIFFVAITVVHTELLRAVSKAKEFQMQEIEGERRA
jgi:hypothetical protein